MKKKLLKKKLVPKKQVIKEESSSPSKTDKKIRASVCGKCGVVLERKPGEKPPICKCGFQMKKSKLAVSIIKKGKVSIDELPTEESHPKHPDRASRSMALLEDASPATRLSNYKQFIASNKSFVDLSNWWELVFPGEDYPEDKPWMLIDLRIEYKLIVAVKIQDGQAITARQLVNYVAVMEMNVDKLTPLLKDLVKGYEEARQSKLSREEEKLVKANKEA